MADGLKNSALPRALSEVIADVADLIQKEMRLARTELSEQLSLKIQGGIWMGAAALLGIIAVLVLIEAAVFGLAAATGLALHWSCLTTAAGEPVFTARCRCHAARSVNDLSRKESGKSPLTA